MSSQNSKWSCDDSAAPAREITLSDVDSRPLWHRLRDGICRLALPYL